MKTIDHTQLDTVNGGASVGGFLKGAGRVAGKLAWPVTAAMGAYDGYNGYSKARQQGHGVGRSVGEGALEAVNGLTFGASNWALGRK